VFWICRRCVAVGYNANAVARLGRMEWKMKTMTAQEILTLAKAWVHLHSVKENSPEWEEAFWAYDRLDEWIHEMPEVAWDAITEIRRLDGSDRLLSNLAAGPLEDFLVYHGEAYINLIEDACKSDDQLRKLLGATWQNEMPDSLWSRIRALALPVW